MRARTCVWKSSTLYGRDLLGVVHWWYHTGTYLIRLESSRMHFGHILRRPFNLMLHTRRLPQWANLVVTLDMVVYHQQPRGRGGRVHSHQQEVHNLASTNKQCFCLFPSITRTQKGTDSSCYQTIPRALVVYNDDFSVDPSPSDHPSSCTYMP